MIVQQYISLNRFRGRSLGQAKGKCTQQDITPVQAGPPVSLSLSPSQKRSRRVSVKSPQRVRVVVRFCVVGDRVC